MQRDGDVVRMAAALQRVAASNDRSAAAAAVLVEEVQRCRKEVRNYLSQ